MSEPNLMKIHTDVVKVFLSEQQTLVTTEGKSGINKLSRINRLGTMFCDTYGRFAFKILIPRTFCDSRVYACLIKQNGLLKSDVTDQPLMPSFAKKTSILELRKRVAAVKKLGNLKKPYPAKQLFE